MLDLPTATSYIDEKPQLHAYKAQKEYSYTFKQASIINNLLVYFTAVLRWLGNTYNSGTCMKLTNTRSF